MAERKTAPSYCIQHTRFAKQDDWRLLDLSVDWYKYIAVSGYNRNTHQTSIDVYSISNSVSRRKPEILFSQEFKKYLSKGKIHRGRLVSFETDSDNIVTCLGDKLEVIQVSEGETLRCCELNGNVTCLFVTKNEIYIGFFQSRQISVYDVKELYKIRNINLEGIQNGDFPFDLTAVDDKFVACVGQDNPNIHSRSLLFGEKNGNILCEFTNPTGAHWYANSVTVCEPLGVVAVVWFNSYYIREETHFQIVFYSLKNENNFNFLVAEDESVSRIRISDRGERLVSGNQVTGEVKLYDMAEIFTYHHLKSHLGSHLHRDDCVLLSDFFALPKDQKYDILKSRRPTQSLLLALEERGAIQPLSVDRLTDAFIELKIGSDSYTVADIYQKTRIQATIYNRLLATLSPHLTVSVLASMCDIFDISDEKEDTIASSQNPGLSLLLTLDEMGVIKPSDVGALYEPFSVNKLVQARAKLFEYQSLFLEVRNQQLLGQTELTEEEKKTLFISRLTMKMLSWYETMTPVPWKKSCKWKSAELFVGSGLILTDSKTKGSLSDIDEQCKLEYSEIFKHVRLQSEDRIILEGDPGSGKTMLMSQLAYDWSVGKFSDIETLILLPLKLVRNKTLVQAIKEFYLQDDSRLTSLDIESFLQNSNKLVHLLLDGLEEYSGEETTRGQSEITEIISKKKYPRCKVVITIRSNYIESLPNYPMLKLGQFGENERHAYIEKVFSGNIDQQVKTKEIINNSSFMLTLCSTPVLFVMIVHNIEYIGKLGGDQPDKVSPFIQRILDILCPSRASERRYMEHFEVKHELSLPLTLEELAFNGLCRGIQLLSWPKVFLEKYVRNSKNWMESGVIVIEEGHVPISANGDQNDSRQQDHEVKSEPESKRTSVSGEIDDNSSQIAERVGKKKLQDTSLEPQLVKRNSGDEGIKSNSEVKYNSRSKYTAHPSSEKVTDSESEYATEGSIEEKSNTVLTQVSLQGRFLHKLIQEWFAAKHLSSLLWESISSNLLRNCVNGHLQYISPADLHYILRFTCFLCPPSYQFITKYLLKTFHSKENEIPDYIMDCIFLCFVECNGKQGINITEIVEEICQENVIINSEDSKLLQQAKVSVLEIASHNLIPIEKLVLADVVVSATEDELTFDSDVKMKALETLRMLELRRWDQKLQDKDYLCILKFISKCYAVKTVRLHLPHQPPDLDEAIMESLQKENKTVNWILGPKMNQQLDTKTGKWMMIPNRKDDETMYSRSLNRAEGKNVDVRTNLYSEKFIDERGGTLFLGEADISLHVPPLALSSGHMLRIIVPLDPNAYSPSSEVLSRLTPLTICEPDNIKFHLPVKLTLPHCAVIKNPKNHTITVKFGHKANDCDKEMIWVTEKADHSLGEHYCNVFLYHFSGVDIIINSTEEKMLRIIPYTKLGHGNKQVLTVWFCNDLESDFQSVIQGEEKNDGFPLDSYDTFRLRCVSELPDANVKLKLEALENSNWRPEEIKAKIDVNRLSNATKNKCNFRLLSDGQDDECYMYLLLRITQVVGEEERETMFAIRKMICDLKMPVMFKKPYAQNGQQKIHLFPTENLPRTYTAVVYMDPVKTVNDDAIITLWLSPFDSATEMFQYLQEEQELQFKHRVDTENSFSVFDDKIAIVSKTTFRNGQWILSPDEKKIETDRIRFGSRAKFQFIGRRKQEDDSTYIDLQIETFQEERSKIKFMTDVEINQLLYEIRREKTGELRHSANQELYRLQVPDDKSYPSATNYLQGTTLPTVNKDLMTQAAARHAHLSPNIENSRTLEERLRKCFLFLKKNLAGDWRDFGRHLNLTEDELQRLSKEYKDDIGESIYQMLLSWQRKYGSEATPEKLTEELRTLGRKDLTETLATM